MSFHVFLQSHMKSVARAKSEYQSRIQTIERQFPFLKWSAHLLRLNKMVTIPSGHCMIGITNQQGDDLLCMGAAVPSPEALRAGRPMLDRLHKQIHLHSYSIGRFPVTNLQFHAFVRETGYTPSGAWILFYEHPLQPATGLHATDVERYCKWAKVRLPTEDEWERAARGVNGNMWPWGNEPDANKCNCKEGKVGKVTHVDHYPHTSPEGCCDMAGNVWEMTSTRLFEESPANIMKGGAFSTLLGNCRGSFRIVPDTSTQWDRVGCRCVNVEGGSPMTIDESLDATFSELTSAPNAADLGARDIHFQESYGIVVHSVRSVFIPTTSPNDGIVISRTRAKTPPKSGQVEGGVAYTKIARLDRVRKPSGVDRLFALHLNPPDGTKVALVKVAGWIYHFTVQKTQEAVKEHLVSEPEFDIETPGGAIVVTSDLNFDERFTRLKVIREAVYLPSVVEHLVALVTEDLQRLTTYGL